jgi:hypothetical protein
MYIHVSKSKNDKIKERKKKKRKLLNNTGWGERARKCSEGRVALT